MSSKATTFSLLAAFLICWVRLIHAIPTERFTSDDERFIFAQTELNQSLLPPKGHKAVAQLYAVGFQHYTYNGTVWVLTNATAELYNARMENVGIHYFLAKKDPQGGQPTWDSVDRPSLVTGKVAVSQSVENAINWVLLQTTRTEGDTDLFGKVTYIQRLYTQEGLPPIFHADKINATYSSPYTAFYVYYKKISRSRRLR